MGVTSGILSQDPAFLKKCKEITDGSFFCALTSAAFSIVVDALLKDESKFSVGLQATLALQGSKKKKKSFVVRTLIRCTRLQTKEALELQDSDHFGPVYLVIAGTTQEIILNAQDHWWQCNMPLQDGHHTPVLFETTKHITKYEELRAHSVDCSCLSDELQVLNQSKFCKDLVKKHGNLLAGPSAFKQTHDTNGGAMEAGAMYCLKGDICHKQQLAPGSCQLYCLVGRKDQVTTDRDDQALFHRTTLFADICLRLWTTKTDISKSDFQALISLLIKSIATSRCSVPITFYNQMDPTLAKHCMDVYENARKDWRNPQHFRPEE